ncbi:MAG: hypothetical protein HRU19_29385 [Pseudobacteriovorax sp.]|nr:hypothetical protein [Pseudobacteriovorax sp.]
MQINLKKALNVDYECVQEVPFPYRPFNRDEFERAVEIASRKGLAKNRTDFINLMVRAFLLAADR